MIKRILLWEKGILGDSNPTQLRGTVLFLLGMNVGLRAGDEHYNLRHDSSDLPSQLQFRRNDQGIRCLVYTEDCTTKTNDGGLKHMCKERKVVWVYPSANSKRCPVRIIDKYMSLLPAVRENRKANFYLRSLERFTPAQWYSEQVVGLNTLRKIMSEISEKAGLKGFFTNHSLRRSGTTRLFQAGIDRKIIKEYTGHTSDAVDKYQETSHVQRKRLSEVIAGDVDLTTKKKTESDDLCNFEIDVGEVGEKSNMACCCGKRVMKVSEASDIGKMIEDIIRMKRGARATVKLQLEFDC